jgi:hypothetical protein
MSRQWTSFVRAAILLGSTFGLMGASCPPTTPVVRPAGDEGSARWAWAIAQPSVAAFAPDAELRQVLGAAIMPDGRLPANKGDWSFVTYSASRSTTFQVTVNYNNTTNTDQRAEAAPGPGIVRPLPADWANSTTVFQATNGHRDASATMANLAVLNVASYTKAPGQATWGINFDAGANQLVSVSGTYIGNE